MLYGLLLTLFIVLCFLIVLIILIQKGKGSIGIGGLGGGAQMLFGGSGGQDLFQKITWIMVALFMSGSLVLAIMKSSGGMSGGTFRPRGTAPVSAPAQKPAMPTSAPQTAPAPQAPAAPTSNK
jgi:preprotein translocase subunit SecG